MFWVTLYKKNFSVVLTDMLSFDFAILQLLNNLKPVITSLISQSLKLRKCDCDADGCGVKQNM